MQNSMCGRKLTCLLCACDRDFQSNYRRRSSKKINVSFNKTQIRKVYISISQTQDEGTGPLASIEHSLMDTRESPSRIL